MKSNLQLKNLRHKFSWLLCLMSFLFIGQSMWAETVKIYFAPSSSWVGSYTLKANYNKKRDGDAWGTSTMTKTVYKYDGRDVYVADIILDYGGLVKLQFQCYNGDFWKQQVEPITSWTGQSSFADKLCKSESDLTWVSFTPTQSYYLKHPWGGGDWSWSDALTDNGDGTYSIEKAYGENGCDWNTAQGSDGATYVSSPTLVGNPTKGDNCVFTLNPTAGTITITKKIDKADQDELILASSAATVCSGNSVTLSTTGGSGDGEVTYAVIEGSGKISGTTLTGSGTVKVQATKAASTNYNEKKSNVVTVTFKGATLTVSPSSVSTNPYAVTTLTATSTPEASVTWSTTTGYFVDENNKKSDVPVANSVKVKLDKTGNVTATVMSDGCTTNTIVPVTVSADTQDCQ